MKVVARQVDRWRKSETSRQAGVRAGWKASENVYRKADGKAVARQVSKWTK